MPNKWCKGIYGDCGNLNMTEKKLLSSFPAPKSAPSSLLNKLAAGWLFFPLPRPCPFYPTHGRPQQRYLSGNPEYTHFSASITPSLAHESQPHLLIGAPTVLQTSTPAPKTVFGKCESRPKTLPLRSSVVSFALRVWLVLPNRPVLAGFSPGSSPCPAPLPGFARLWFSLPRVRFPDSFPLRKPYSVFRALPNLRALPLGRRGPALGKRPLLPATTALPSSPSLQRKAPQSNLLPPLCCSFLSCFPWSLLTERSPVTPKTKSEQIWWSVLCPHHPRPCVKALSNFS